MNLLKIKHSLVHQLNKEFLDLYEEYHIKQKNPKNRYFILKKFNEDGLKFLSKIISLLTIIEEDDIFISYGINGIPFFSTNKETHLWVNTQIMEIYYGKEYRDINEDEKKYFLSLVLKKINEALGYEIKAIYELSTPTQSVSKAI